MTVRTSRRFGRDTGVTLALSAALWSAGCGTDAQDSQAPPAPPAMRVPVATPDARDVPLVATFTGRVEAVNHVELRPRVSGYLEEILFREGALVRAGTPLFRVDQRPFLIALRRAEAELAAVEAQLVRAREELARAERLSAEQAVSREELDRRRADLAALEARRLSAEAVIADARLQVEFTVVRAPVSGRIGRAEVTRGNLVSGGAGNSTRLSLLTSLDPIYVYFDVDPTTAAAAQTAGRAGWKATVTPLDGGTSRVGTIDFVNNTVGEDTGTLQLRARLPNGDGRFLPSSIVNVTFEYGVARQAIVIPETAIGTDQGVRYVLVVGADKTLEYRPVNLGPAVEGGRVIAGTTLSPSDRVVLQGTPGLRPGMSVEPFTPDSPGAGAGASAPQGARR